MPLEWQPVQMQTLFMVAHLQNELGRTPCERYPAAIRQLDTLAA